MEDAYRQWQQADRGAARPPGMMPPHMGGHPMFPNPMMAQPGFPAPVPGYQQPMYSHAVPPAPGSIAALRAAGQMATAAAGAMSAKPKPEKKKGGLLREAAGKRWRDLTLEEWPENDYRIFVGDLGNDCNDDVLGKAFQKYPSFAKAKIIKDPRTKKSRGYGFVSFLNSEDFAKALREMNGKYIGNRPCKLRKSTWDERSVHQPHKKQKKQDKQDKN